MRRISIALSIAALGTAILACSGPYSGKPEKVVMPKEKPVPDAGPQEANADKPPPPPADTCRANFFADPVPLVKRDPKKAIGMSQQANRQLLDAEVLTGDARKTKVIDAIATLKNALKADPYGAEATLQMAVAYAMVGKKACALSLLERLAELKKVPELEKDVTRVIQRAARDPAFEAFRDEAKAKLGV